MSFFDRTKEFFGLAPVDIDAMDQDDAYYADNASYTSNGSAAYAPREEYKPAPRAFEPTIVAVALDSYKQAVEIGRPFRDGDAVVFEVTDASIDHARRLIDFSAGLVYYVDGQMRNLTSGMNTDRKVFAILPHGCNIPVSELERVAQLR